MTSFHNPYHFVPVKKWVSGENDLSSQAFARAAAGDPEVLGHISHHRFADSEPGRTIYDGRILCRLENEDPFFVGGYRLHAGTNDRPACWVPYELEDGVPAIPASSLRGLISAIAEAASGSAMRVLQDGPFSRRALADRTDPLRELGEIVKMPSVEGEVRCGVRPFIRAPKKLSTYRKIRVGDATELEWDPLSVIAANARSYSADNKQFWYLSQDQATGAYRLHSEPEYKRLRSPAMGFERGVLRILGILDSEGRKRQMFQDRLSELFIPYPAEQESVKPLDAQDAIERFHALADECTKRGEDLPFQVAGARRNDGDEPNDKRLRLRPGDLVYFGRDPLDQGRVQEVALSAIWRKGIGGTRHEFFAKVSKELLPFSLARETISPAELVFGFVEAREKGEWEKQAWALASRVRFSHAELVSPKGEAHYLPPVTLKVLDSPKPPYPPFCFKHRASVSQDFVTKEGLSLSDHVPQGRKLYLHRFRDGKKEPWRTDPENEIDTLKQKSRITPVKRGRVFYFHVDFENLSAYELGMLCYALRPTPEFRHKLGMGKPLGLGKVRIDPGGLFLIDRKRRYGTDALLGSLRYHRIALSGEAQPNEWPGERYGREVAESKGRDERSRGNTLLDTLRKDFGERMDPSIHRALALLGDPDRVRAPVHTPQLEGLDGPELERETYKWFEANEGRRQYLTALDLDEGLSDLQTLER